MISLAITAAKSKTQAEDSKARATRLFCAEFAQQFDNINSLVQDNERLIGSEQSWQSRQSGQSGQSSNATSNVAVAQASVTAPRRVARGSRAKTAVNRP